MKEIPYNQSKRGELSMNGRTSVLIAECEPVVRFGTSEYLRRRPEWQVCGDADSAPSTRALCETHKPDVLVLNPALTGDEGFSLIKEAPRWNEKMRIVIFTTLEDADSVVRAFRAGALAYVTRREPLEQLILAIEAALLGNEYMGPRVQRALSSQMRSGRMELSSDPTVGLSSRERQIFHLLGNGRGKRNIAEELKLSSKTVDTHQQRIKDKLGIASCAELRKQAAIHVNRAAAHVLDAPSPDERTTN